MPAPTMRTALAPAVHAFEYWLYRYRTTWRGTAVSTLVSPVLFLSALGIGLGSLIESGTGGAGLGGTDYLAFLAPGLLAANAMQTAVEESSWPVYGAVRWWKGYLAMQVTPLRSGDLLAGHLMFTALRLALVGAVFLAVAAAFGAFSSVWVLAAWPVAVLCGLAHAAPVAGWAISRQSESAFGGLHRYVVMPMFLFSGTFFPVTQLPVALESVAYLTPLWHGVDLCRDLALGEATMWSAAGHVGYLAAWVAGGSALAARAYARRLAA